MMFVVLGRTAEIKSSRRILGRCKNRLTELNDVFEVERLRKQARKLMVFKVVDPENQLDPDTFYLISFDLRGGWRTREYSVIKKMMLMRLCAHIDCSTYVCPADYSLVCAHYAGYENVKVWIVKPYNENAINALREGIHEAIEFIIEELEKRKKRLRGQGVRAAARTAMTLDFILKNEKVKQKMKWLGIELSEIAVANEELKTKLKEKGVIRI